MKDIYKYSAAKVAELTGYSVENIYRLRKKYGLGREVLPKRVLFSDHDVNIIERNKFLDRMSPEARKKISEKNRAFRRTKKGREMMAKAWETRRNNRRK